MLLSIIAVACDYNKLKSFDVTVELTTLCCVHVFTYPVNSIYMYMLQYIKREIEGEKVKGIVYFQRRAIAMILT